MSVIDVDVPACLTRRAVELVAQAQDLLCEVDKVAGSWQQLASAVEPLCPPDVDLTVSESDRITEEWNEFAGVGPLMHVLMQIASVIVDATGCAAGGPPPTHGDEQPRRRLGASHGART